MLVWRQFSKCRKSQLIWENVRNFATVKVKDRVKDEDDDGLNELMHGRKNMERRDSVNDVILLERQAHQLRIKVSPGSIYNSRLLTFILGLC